MSFFSLIRRLAWRFGDHPLSKKRGKSSSRRPLLEALEGRVVPANISIDPVQGGAVRLVDANGLPILAPVYGQRVNVQVTARVTDVVDANGDPASASVAVAIDGQTLFGSVVGGMGSFLRTFSLNGWYAGPGTHLVEVEVDPFNGIAETNEQPQDNFFSFSYAPIAPVNNPVLAVPVTGQRDVDWHLASYIDINPTGGVEDYLGGGFATAGNQGIDFALESYRRQDDGDVAVVAAAGGTVKTVVDGQFDRQLTGGSGLGNYVEIDHGNGWITRYRGLHENTIVVKVGDFVRPGQLLGLLGGSGTTNHPGLRFDLLYNNNFATNPNGQGSPIETFAVPPVFSYWVAPPNYQGDHDIQVFYANLNTTDPAGLIGEEPQGPPTIPSLYGDPASPTANTSNLYFAGRVNQLPGGGYVVWRLNGQEISYTPVGALLDIRPFTDGWYTVIPDPDATNPYLDFQAFIPPTALTPPAPPYPPNAVLPNTPPGAWNPINNNINPRAGTWTVELRQGSRTGPVVFSRNFTVTNGTNVGATADIKVTTPSPGGGTALVVDNRNSAFDFGNVAVGGDAPDITFTVRNEGFAPLFWGVDLPAGYLLTALGDTSLNPGETADFTITMNTSAPGFKFGLVNISSNDGGGGEDDINFRVEGTVTGGNPQPAIPFINAGTGAPVGVGFEQAPITLKDNTLTLTDSDSAFYLTPNPDFRNGLEVDFADDGDPTDVLAIRHQGFGPLQVGVVDNRIFFGGKFVGTFEGGTNGDPLEVDFNENSTRAAVEAILRQLTFTSTGSEGGQRVVEMSVVDDEGFRSNRVFSYIVVADTAPTSVNLPFNDPFTQTDGQRLNLSWTDRVGGFRVFGNQAQANATPLNISTVNLANPVADVDVSALVNVPVAGNAAGVVARYSGPGDSNMYWGGLVNNGPNVSAQIWRNVGGTWTLLASATTGAVSGTLRLEAVGNLLRLSLNGTLLVSFVDPTPLLTPGTVGIRTNAGMTLDNFTADALVQPTTVSDNLNGADTTAIAPPWNEQVGDIARQNNQFVGNSALNLATFAGLALADGGAEANVNVPASGDFAGLVARYGGPGDRNMYYGGLINNDGTVTAQVWRNVGGTWTLLASAAAGGTNGILRFEVVGSSLKLFFDNVVLIQTYDTAITRVGVFGIRGGQGETFDNFRAFDLTPVRVTIPAPPSGPFTDFFTLANDSTLARHWIDRAGAFIVQGGRAAGQAPVNVVTLNTLLETDVTVGANVNLSTTGLSHAGVVARYSGPGDSNMYLGMIVGNNGVFTAEIWRNLGGTWTRLGSTSVASGTGNLTFRVQGNRLVLTFGATSLRVLDGAITGPGLVGMRSSGNASLDNFTVIQTPPDELPLTDGFNRAASDSIGALWREEVGDLQIAPNSTLSSNILQVKPTSPLGLATFTDVSIADGAVSAFFELPRTGSAQAGVVARYQGTGDRNMYLGMVVANNNTFTGQIWKNVNGVWTLLSSAPLPIIPPGVPTYQGTVRLEVQGSRLSLIVNTTLITGAIDFSVSGAGLFGVRGSAGQTFENFTIDRVFAIPPFRDDFNRAPSNNLGAQWREEAGDLEINSNGRLRGKLGVNIATNTTLSYADGIVEMLVELSTNQFAGAVARYSGPGDSNMYWGGLVNSGGVTFAEIWRNVGGVWTRLASANLGAGVTGGNIRFVVTGSQLQLYLNGAGVAGAIDSQITAPGLFGARMGAGATVDDYNVIPI